MLPGPRDTTHRFYVDGGFAQVHNNTVTVLTSTAMPAAELDAATIEEQLAEARLLPTPDADADAAKFLAISRARAQRRLLAHLPV